MAKKRCVKPRFRGVFAYICIKVAAFEASAPGPRRGLWSALADVISRPRGRLPAASQLDKEFGMKTYENHSVRSSSFCSLCSLFSRGSATEEDLEEDDEELSLGLALAGYCT